MDGKKPVHELSREEFFNDPEHVRSTMPSKHQIHFKYPIGKGHGKSSFTSDKSMKRGESVNYGTVSGATVTASKEFKPNYNNLEMYEHGKKHHKEAVESAHAAGKAIPSHVLKDYPHLSSQHTESLRFEELVNQGPLAQFGSIQFRNELDAEKHKDLIGDFEHKPKNPNHKGFTYRVGKARYANGQLSVDMGGGDGWKHRGHRLVDHLKGRYSGRENSYIMSPGKVKKLHDLINSGHDASMFGKLIPPDADSQHSESCLASNEQDIEQLVHSSLQRE